jgi:hypothetical protein
LFEKLKCRRESNSSSNATQFEESSHRNFKKEPPKKSPKRIFKFPDKNDENSEESESESEGTFSETDSNLSSNYNKNKGRMNRSGSFYLCDPKSPVKPRISTQCSFQTLESLNINVCSPLCEEGIKQMSNSKLKEFEKEFIGKLECIQAELSRRSIISDPINAYTITLGDKNDNTKDKIQEMRNEESEFKKRIKSSKYVKLSEESENSDNSTQSKEELLQQIANLNSELVFHKTQRQV